MELMKQMTSVRRWRGALVAPAVAALGWLGLPAAAAAKPVPATASCRTGIITQRPDPVGRTGYVTLAGVSAQSKQNVWAVGEDTTGKGVVAYRPLVEHWNGSAWSLVATKRVHPYMILSAVAAVSASSVWMVGWGSHTQVATPYPVIEHWNGSAWRVVPSPVLPGELNALAVASPDDIWAVGLRQVQVGGQLAGHTLVEHWDGTHWRVMASPNPQLGDLLTGVTVAGPDDVWATGDTVTSTHDDTAPLAEQWNGSTWSVVTMPAAGFSSQLRGLTSTGPDNVWAVGDYDVQTPTGTATFTLAEHWNGRTWSVSFPPSPTGDDVLNGISAGSASNMWAVGGTVLHQTFVLNWDGHGWKGISGDPTPGNIPGLDAVSVLSTSTATDVWAVGGTYRPLIEYLCAPATS